MTTPQQQPNANAPGTPAETDQQSGQARQQWVWFLWLSVAILLLFYYLDAAQDTQTAPLPYSEFLEAVEDGHIQEVTLRGEHIHGRLTDGGQQALDLGAERFRSVRPAIEDRQLLETLEANGVTIAAQPTEPPWWQRILVSALPWILLLGFVLWLSYRVQQNMMSGGGMLGFGRSQARKFRREDSHIGLDEVAGSDQAKQDVGEIVEFLKNPERFRQLGAQIPRGILMMGPPGTGKTLMARAVAGEANVPFYSISGSEFIEMFVGVGASRVRDLFKQAKSEAPAVVFIDEIDAIGRSRGAGMGGGHDEREQTLNQILAEMDGFDADESVVVLAATNRPDVLDAALMRPGRFDRKITLERPHKEARRAILGVHTQSVPLAGDVDLDHLAETTAGFSGADLANLVNEAALLAGRRGLESVDWACLSAARDRLLLGQARDSALSDAEQRLVAYHESGHALLAYLLPNADPLEKVTIIPRGQALGVTAQTPSEERYNLTESYLRDRIAVMLGGRTAESLVFGEVSSGAENDLQQATQLARRMVGRWGMSPTIGPVAFAENQEHVFLGREIAQGREHSDATAERMDAEVQRLITDIENQARDLLEHNRDRLDRLARALREYESLEADAVRTILDAPSGHSE